MPTDKLFGIVKASALKYWVYARKYLTGYYDDFNPHRCQLGSNDHWGPKISFIPLEVIEVGNVDKANKSVKLKKILKGLF